MIPDFMPTLSVGAHGPDSGKACLMEYVSLLAGEGWTDTPDCTNIILSRAAHNTNDNLGDKDRHQLIPLIGRLMGTAEPMEDVSLDQLRDEYVINVRLLLWAVRHVRSKITLEVLGIDDLLDAIEGWCDGTVSAKEMIEFANRASGPVPWNRGSDSLSEDDQDNVADLRSAAISTAWAVLNYELSLEENYVPAVPLVVAGDWVAGDWVLATLEDLYNCLDYEELVPTLTGLIDEYDRLTGRAEHREVTDSELADLGHRVAASANV